MRPYSPAKRSAAPSFQQSNAAAALVLQAVTYELAKGAAAPTAIQEYPAAHRLPVFGFCRLLLLRRSSGFRRRPSQPIEQPSYSREYIDRQWEYNRGVFLRADLHQRLQIAQLDRHGLA
jgi:hypothetical protein